MFKEFQISEIFETHPFRNGLQVPTGAAVKQDMLHPGEMPRITVTSDNNGIGGYYADINDKNYRIFENCISVSFLGTVFYHPYKASFDMKVHCLKPKNHELNEKEALYLLPIIRKQFRENSYFNQTTSTDLPYMKIFLPVDEAGNIDWAYMQERIAELEQERIAELDVYLKISGLEDYELTDEDRKILENHNPYGFGEFRITDLFSLQPASEKVSKLEFAPNGKIPAYSSDTRNNGCLGFVNQKPTFYVTEKIPTYLIFGDHTKTTNIVHQDFCVLDNVKVLIPKEKISDEALLYITTAWKKAIPNLGYARHWSIANKVKFKLPIINNGIDIIYMERYIRATEKLVIADVVRYKDQIISETKKIAG